MARTAYRHGDVIIVALSPNEASQLRDVNKTDEYEIEEGKSITATLALGEVTGHSHEVDGVTALVEGVTADWENREILSEIAAQLGFAGGVERSGWRMGSTSTAVVKGTVASIPEDAKLMTIGEGGGTLTHQEHATIKLPAGDYISFQQREFWGQGERRVYD